MTFEFNKTTATTRTEEQEKAEDNLKLEIWFVNMEIRKAFADQQIRVDDIIWNPRRSSMTCDRFNIHSIQVTIGAWQETLYRIETRDIKNFAAGIKRDSIQHRIAELLEKYLHFIADKTVTGSRKRALSVPRHLAR